MIIDPATLRDLEVFRSSGGGPGLFDLLDFTKTSLGSAALRSRLTEPLSDADTIREHHLAIGFLRRSDLTFFADEPHVEVVQRYLSSNIQVASRRRAGGVHMEGAWLALRYRDVFMELKEGLRATARFFRDLEAYTQRVARLDPPPLLAGLCTQVKRLVGQPDMTMAVTHGGGPGAVLRADGILRVDKRGEVLALMEIVAALDMLHSMAMAEVRLGLTPPEVVDDEMFLLEVDGLVHPFVENPVPNPLRLSDEGSLLFLTGPNMAGKTTYLRSAAIALLLAHTGMGVPATRFRFVPVDALLTSINTEDDLRSGLSYFMAEVRRVKEIAEALAAGQRAFVLFDEVFKGTNVLDALEASEMVIRGFSRSRRSGFIFASHLSELATALSDEPSVRFACFDGEIRDTGATYGYALKEGVSEQRFGLHLLERERVPELLERIRG